MNLVIKQENNTTYHYIETKQFKTMHIHVRFIRPLNRETVTKEAVMLGLMRAKNSLTQSRKAQTRFLEALYDASFYAHTMKLGMQKIDQFTLSFIHPDFTEDDDIIKEALTFLSAALFEPLFDAQTLREEKQFLHDYFLAEYSNKNRYAYKQYIRHLYENHPYNIEAIGYQDEIEEVSLEDVKAMHKTMLEDSSITVSVTGDVDAETLHPRLLETLKFNSQMLPKDFLVRHAFTAKDELKEEKEVNQDRLFMTLDTKTFFKDKNYFSILVFNSLFGESSDSLLFKTVRETLSLAYYVHSSYIPFTGVITIASGMDSKNIEAAKQAILECLATVQEGAFTDKALEIAKTSLITSIKQSYDNSQALSLKALRHTLLDTPFEEDYVLNELKRVSKEDVLAVAKQCEPIFTYVLGGTKDENTEL